MRKWIVGVLSAGALSFCAMGFAADDAAFKKMDKNGDGKISLEEFVGKREGEKATKAKERFAKMDKNSDGAITADEFKGPKKKKDN